MAINKDDIYDDLNAIDLEQISKDEIDRDLETNWCIIRCIYCGKVINMLTSEAHEEGFSCRGGC